MPDQESQARLLALYVQKQRDLLEKADQMRAALLNITDEVERKRRAGKLARLLQAAEDQRMCAERLRTALRDDPAS